MVRFPNLLAAMAARGKKHYEVARNLEMDEGTFSRCGSLEEGLFTPSEPVRCDYLNFEQAFLKFAYFKPPRTRLMRDLYLRAARRCGSEDAVLDSLRSCLTPSAFRTRSNAAEEFLRSLAEV